MAGFDKFVGKWSSNTIENFDNFMKELDVGYLTRKAGSFATTYYQISLNGTKVNFKYKIATKKGDLNFHFDEEFEKTTPDGRKVKSTYTFENGKFNEIQRGKPYDTYVERSIQDDGLMLEIAVANGVKCTRTYKRDDSFNL